MEWLNVYLEKRLTKEIWYDILRIEKIKNFNRAGR